MGCTVSSAATTVSNNDPLDTSNEIQQINSGLFEQTQLDIIRVYHNDPICPMGWPGKPVISVNIIEEMIPVIGVHISCTARDQGWGNAGHSKMMLILQNEHGEVKSQSNVSQVYHDERDIDVHIAISHFLLQSINIGDVLGLWAVSAPYQGFECICIQARISIHTMDTDNTHRANNDATATEQSTHDLWHHPPTEGVANSVMDSMSVASIVMYLHNTYLIDEERAREAIDSVMANGVDEDIASAALDWLFTHPQPTSDTDNVSSETQVPETATPALPAPFPHRLESDITSRSMSPVKMTSMKRHSSYDNYCCVCFELYVDRVATHCKHFFCRACIMSYISATPDSKSCLCPMCRRPVRVTDLVSVPTGMSLSEVMNVQQSLEVTREGEDSITYLAESPRIIPNHLDVLQRGWYCKGYVTLNVPSSGARGLHVTCVGKDQGFGGSNKSCFMISRGKPGRSKNIIAVHLIGTVLCTYQEYSQDIEFSNTSLGTPEAGDMIELLMVCPPW
eukprot:CAMPEP_0185032178 /NCGR_PEP_ID=MMETSP1103-20130426/20083_1 /TAXON_ID=36769 /ORGANISM="Paraphysomonas bandaiensis, Strain Caron Lab Isolate" /LENGTH=506 /DNA_ID=CAMNT_0027567977 /DNA_START=109 /DNA_END=1626 /DNA_ORIENTATION=+